MADQPSSSRLSDIVEAIWRRDPTIFGAPRSLEPLLANRYGWLDVATRMRSQVSDLTRLRHALLTEGKTKAVLLGMGGSSLAALVMRDAFGERDDGLAISVLDSTHPDAVNAIGATHPAATSVFIVASKSGTTTEPRCFQQRFWSDAVTSAGFHRAGNSFVGITDSGSQLGAIAARDGYRRVFVNPPDIGGRYSALSFFGLVPAALAGYDIGSILTGAEAAAALCRDPNADRNPGLRLGAFLAANAATGRDKLTLVCPEPFTSLGVWVEQLIAESLGKHRRGILPIEGEPLGHPESYGPDRMFVAVDVRHRREDGALDGSGGLDTRLDAIEASGIPVLRIASSDATDLGWLFFVWEFATTVAAALLGIEPFDQPDVERAKIETRRVLSQAAAARTVDLPDDADVGVDSAELVRALSAVGASGYLAVNAYIRPTQKSDAALARLRDRIRARSDRPVTIGYGPRFLHSTGQLHKGGPIGVCVQLVQRPDKSEDPIPGEWFGFGQLIAAQALGDFEALRSLGRPAMRIELPTEDPAGSIDLLLAD
jgi:transaldolase/glucose-6-phosphate isomerase